jgi:hypothetical protein
VFTADQSNVEERAYLAATCWRSGQGTEDGLVRADLAVASSRQRFDLRCWVVDQRVRGPDQHYGPVVGVDDLLHLPGVHGPSVAVIARDNVVADSRDSGILAIDMKDEPSALPVRGVQFAPEDKFHAGTVSARDCLRQPLPSPTRGSSRSRGRPMPDIHPWGHLHPSAGLPARTGMGAQLLGDAIVLGWSGRMVNMTWKSQLGSHLGRVRAEDVERLSNRLGQAGRCADRPSKARQAAHHHHTEEALWRRSLGRRTPWW